MTEMDQLGVALFTLCLESEAEFTNTHNSEDMGSDCSSLCRDRITRREIRAAKTIQKCYRSYSIQLETRQLYAFSIFQSLEYADEQCQIQLSDFLTFLLEHSAKACEENPDIVSQLLGGNLQDKDEEDYVEMIDVPDSYDGPRLQFPLTSTDIDLLIDAFRKEKILHAHYVLAVLSEAKKLLMLKPNISSVQISPWKEITVCGDLHGKLDDLLFIFCTIGDDGSMLQSGWTSTIKFAKEIKNGPPSDDTPYVFNGDFVDRGKNSIEVLMILLVSLLVYPNDFHLNRGSHEDFLMNLRCGFAEEIMTKYTVYGRKILKALKEVFAWLPIGTIVNNEILILHGGISEATDLDLLCRIERSKIKSVLMPPVPSGGEVTTDFWRNRVSGKRRKPEVSLYDRLLQREWEQVIDILWSDPRDKNGCYPNKNRGGGCYFGPDVTTRILHKYHLRLLIRSHECKPSGYEISHEEKVITIFSASNYYEEGSNQGAFLKLGHCRPPTFFPYQVTKSRRRNSLSQRADIIESSAIRILKERMVSQKTDLVRALKRQDRKEAGRISLAKWAFTMETVMGLNLPWRWLSTRLMNTDDDGNFDFMSIFEDVHIQNLVQEVHSTLIETFYRYRFDLHIIFNVIDTDHSGFISLDEFRGMWKLFSCYYDVCVDDSEVDELANKMDLNKDGSIDFNEFFKAFYVVHKFDTSPTSGNTALSQH